MNVNIRVQDFRPTDRSEDVSPGTLVFTTNMSSWFIIVPGKPHQPGVTIWVQLSRNPTAVGDEACHVEIVGADILTFTDDTIVELWRRSIVIVGRKRPRCRTFMNTKRASRFTAPTRGQRSSKQIGRAH